MRVCRSRPDNAPTIHVAAMKSRARSRMFAAATLALGCAWMATGNAAHAASTVAMLPIKLLDTSAEPADQAKDHTRRLEVFGNRLATDLTKAGVYNVVEVTASDIKKECPVEDTKCLLSAARQRGAGLMLIGVVHKSSSLIMQMFARLYDVKSEKEVFAQDLNFRGDNDESWRRAEAFLIEQFERAEQTKEAKSSQ